MAIRPGLRASQPDSLAMAEAQSYAAGKAGEELVTVRAHITRRVHCVAKPLSQAGHGR
jgi:hypothetical protein